MAQYDINFSTNASRIAKELGTVQSELAKVMRVAKPGGFSIKLNLNTADFTRAISSSFKELDRSISEIEKKLRQAKIGSPEFRLAAEQSGQLRGESQRAQMMARAIGSRESAKAFDVGSLTRYEQVLESLRIQASLVAPNTQEWVNFQKSIAQVTFELKQADKAAESIQLTQQLGALAPGSLSRLEAQLTVLRNRARDISPDTLEWRRLNKEIQKTETSIQKISRKPLSTQQRVGAAGGAFLYGGGLGGGAGSALGGIAGGLAGGVPGAFAGAAVGQAVDDLTTMTAAMTDQAAVIGKLQTGLATASNNLQDFALATREVDSIATRLQLPLEEVYRKFTQLRSSTVALGIDTETTGQIFEGTAAAVLKSGGSMDDVSGAMRAVVQVFSKGKLTAEELRGQLGERLPGAVVEFAKSSGRSVQELDAAFEAGGLTLDEFVTFLRGKAKESGDFVDEMSQRSEYAGARMAKAFEKMQLNIGASLQPAGAAIQDFITRSINGFDLLIRKAIELKLMQPGADFYVGQALAGDNGGIAGLKNQLLAAAEAEASARDLASKGGLGFLADLLPEVRATAKEAKILKEALTKIRNLEKLTKQRKVDAETQGEKDKAADAMLNAIENKEEAISAAKKRREEEIIEIRKQAVAEAKRIEEDIAKQRLTREREIAGIKRELAGVQVDVGFELQAVNVASTGGDPKAVRIQQQISEAARRRDEDKIAVEQKILDEQTERTKALEQLKVVTSSAINEANVRYAKAIGEAQQSYAHSVAKIIDEGTGKAGKRLVQAGQLAGLYLQRATLNQQIGTGSGFVIPEPEGGKYKMLPGKAPFSGGELLESKALESVAMPLNALLDVDKKIQEVTKTLQQSIKITAPAVQSITVNIQDLTNRLSSGAQSLDKLASSFKEASSALSDASFFKDFVGIGTAQAQGVIDIRKDLEDQSSKMSGILDLRKLGLKPEQAEQMYDITLRYNEALLRLGSAYDSARAQAAPGQEAALAAAYDTIATSIQEAYTGAMQFSDAINNIPIQIKLETSIQDIKDKLNDLLDPVNQIKGAANAIGDSFGNAFKGVITGSMTAQEALAGFFQSVADSFADMAAKMIAEYMKMALIKGIMGIIGGAVGALGGGLSSGFNAGTSSAIDTGAAGWASSFATPLKFANGGIAPGGFTAFANGGVVTGPTLGLVGEGRYNEAVIPLPDGKSVPVDIGGATGNQITSNIVVNVSSDGKTSSSGAGADSAGLGRKLEGAVKQVILDELRDGGILAGRR